MANMNTNFKQLYEIYLLQFKSDIAVAKVEYGCCIENIQHIEEDIEYLSSKGRKVDGLRKLLTEERAKKAELDVEFEKYKAKYLELLRDISGTVGESKLADYTV